MLYKSIVLKQNNITNKRLFGLGLSIAYVLTIIFTGIGF